MLESRSLRDERLLEMARSDREAFGEFYRRNVAWVLRVCGRATRDPEISADLTAEVFAAALLGVGRFRAEKGTAHNWLLGIVIHKIASFERRGAVERHGRRRLAVEAYELTERDRVDFAELIVAESAEPSILRLLARLPTDQAAAVRARIIEGESYSELAHRHGISEATARKRVSRGLKQLRALIGAPDA